MRTGLGYAHRTQIRTRNADPRRNRPIQHFPILWNRTPSLIFSYTYKRMHPNHARCANRAGLLCMTRGPGNYDTQVYDSKELRSPEPTLRTGRADESAHHPPRCDGWRSRKPTAHVPVVDQFIEPTTHSGLDRIGTICRSPHLPHRY